MARKPKYSDEDMIRMYNNHGSFTGVAKVSGMAISSVEARIKKLKKINPNHFKSESLTATKEIKDEIEFNESRESDDELLRMMEMEEDLPSWVSLSKRKELAQVRKLNAEARHKEKLSKPPDTVACEELLRSMQWLCRNIMNRVAESEKNKDRKADIYKQFEIIESEYKQYITNTYPEITFTDV